MYTFVFLKRYYGYSIRLVSYFFNQLVFQLLLSHLSSIDSWMSCPVTVFLIRQNGEDGDFLSLTKYPQISLFYGRNDRDRVGRWDGRTWVLVMVIKEENGETLL